MGEQASLAQMVRSACSRADAVHGRGAAGATVAARLHHAKDDGETARLRRVERREHAPGFTAWVIRADREMYRGWLSVPGPSAPPGAGVSVWGFWLEQAHAERPAVVIDALDDVSG